MSQIFLPAEETLHRDPLFPLGQHILLIFKQIEKFCTNVRCLFFKVAPVQNRNQFATQPRNKCFLMKIDKHLEYLNTRTVVKLVLGLYLQSFRAFRVVLL